MVPALFFQKVVVSYHELRGPRIACLLLGPPCVQQYVGERIRGGGPKCLKICSKTYFLIKSRCVAGPGFWPKSIQIEASSLWCPPLRSAIRRDSPPGRGVQLSQNLFKKNTFGTTLGVLLAQDVCQNCSQSKRLHFWAPPFRPPIRRDSPPGKGGANVSKFVQKFAF